MKTILLLTGLCLSCSVAMGQEQVQQTQFVIEGLKKMMLDRITHVKDLIDQNRLEEAKRALAESYDRVNGATLVYDLEVQKQLNGLQEKISGLQKQLSGKEDEIAGYKKSVESLMAISKYAKEDQTKQIVEVMKQNGQQAVDHEKLTTAIEDLKSRNEKLATEKTLLSNRINTDSLDLVRTHSSFKSVMSQASEIYKDSIEKLNEALIKFNSPLQFGLSLGYNVTFASPIIHQIQQDSSAIKTGNKHLSTGMLSVVVLIPVGKKQEWNFVANLPLTSFNGSIGLFNEAVAFGGGVAWRLPRNKNSLLTFIANVTPYKAPIESTLQSKYPYSPGTALTKDNCNCATEQTSNWSFSIGYILRITSPENYGSFPFTKKK